MKTLSPALFTFMLFLLLISCQTETAGPADPSITGSKTEDQTNIIPKVLIDAKRYDNSKTFDYRIDSAWIVTDFLKLQVSYTGCEPGVSNRVLGDGSFMESYPVQTRLKFVLDNPGDCDMAIVEELSFDLVHLRESYQKSYGVQPATLIIQLNGYGKPLDYKF